jgi:ABC-type Fe3+/spermidine/putrescine transport system ATPase subunit
MNNGGIEQVGTPEAIYNRPKNRFVADFVKHRIGRGASKCAFQL